MGSGRCTCAVRLAALLLPLVVSCGSGEREVRDGSGLVLWLPADWTESRADGAVSWSGAPGTPAWRTTVNLHSVPLTTDEVTRSVDTVAKALLVQYGRLDGARTRLGRGARIGGRQAVRLDVRFRRGETRYRRRHLVVRHADRIVHVDATAPEDLWDRIEPIWQRAVDTARWEDT